MKRTKKTPGKQQDQKDKASSPLGSGYTGKFYAKLTTPPSLHTSSNIATLAVATETLSQHILLGSHGDAAHSIMQGLEVHACLEHRRELTVS